MKQSQTIDPQKAIASTRRWVETMVVGMNLCPFAKRELVKESIRFTVTAETTETELLRVLHRELQRLEENSDIATTLLIHPHVLEDFFDYNYFLDTADQLLAQMNLEGIYQIASFHPSYQFAGTEIDDAENYTNRSPYPTLHLLREDSLERAIDAYPDVDEIPTRNIAQMNSLGVARLKAILEAL